MAACEPGVSVSKLAQAHGVNANMLFKWRRDLRAGQLDSPVPDATKLLPVVVQRVPVQTTVPSAASHVRTIEIVICDATVRVGAETDAALLRMVLQSLRA